MKVKINIANDIALFKQNLYDLFVNPKSKFIASRINRQTYIFLMAISIFMIISLVIPIRLVNESHNILISYLYFIVYIFWMICFVFITYRRIRNSSIGIIYSIPTFIGVAIFLGIQYHIEIPNVSDFVLVYSDSKNVLRYIIEIPLGWKYLVGTIFLLAFILPENQKDSSCYKKGIIVNDNEILRLWGKRTVNAEKQIDTSLLERDIEFSDTVKRVFFTHVLDFQGRTTRREIASLSVGVYFIGTFWGIYKHFTPPDVVAYIMEITRDLLVIPWLSMAV